MRVEWTRNAITDLAEIYEYIAKDSPPPLEI
jgi:plasmid stabilization system protein ParE